jgi:hypothetical protein
MTEKERTDFLRRYVKPSKTRVQKSVYHPGFWEVVFPTGSHRDNFETWEEAMHFALLVLSVEGKSKI